MTTPQHDVSLSSFSAFPEGHRILQEHHDQCSVMQYLLRKEMRSNYVQLRFVTIYNQQISSRSAKAQAWVHTFTYMSSYLNFERNYICYTILTRTEFEIFTPANVKLIYSSTHYNRVTLKHAAYIIFIFSSQSMRVSRFFFLFKLGPYPCVATVIKNNFTIVCRGSENMKFKVN